jgi:hypothetical protein
VAGSGYVFSGSVFLSGFSGSGCSSSDSCCRCSCSALDVLGLIPISRYFADGTKGFIRKEQYAVCVALIEDGQVQVRFLFLSCLSSTYIPDIPFWKHNNTAHSFTSYTLQVGVLACPNMHIGYVADNEEGSYGESKNQVTT